jgi:hypothetical protein
LHEELGAASKPFQDALSVQDLMERTLQIEHVALKVSFRGEARGCSSDLCPFVEQSATTGDRKLLLERQEFVADTRGVLHLVGDVGIPHSRLGPQRRIDGSLDKGQPSGLGALLQEDKDRDRLGQRTGRGLCDRSR